MAHTPLDDAIATRRGHRRKGDGLGSSANRIPGRSRVSPIWRLAPEARPRRCSCRHIGLSDIIIPSRNCALIYIRKSVVRTGADAVSPERQRARCLEEAERHGWIVEPGDIYTDSEGHMSGRTDNRADWQRLRHRLRRHDIIAAVIVESLSRTSQASQAAGYLANRRRMPI